MGFAVALAARADGACRAWREDAPPRLRATQCDSRKQQSFNAGTHGAYRALAHILRAGRQQILTRSRHWPPRFFNPLASTLYTLKRAVSKEIAALSLPIFSRVASPHAFVTKGTNDIHKTVAQQRSRTSFRAFVLVARRQTHRERLTTIIRVVLGATDGGLLIFLVRFVEQVATRDAERHFRAHDLEIVTEHKIKIDARVFEHGRHTRSTRRTADQDAFGGVADQHRQF